MRSGLATRPTTNALCGSVSAGGGWMQGTSGRLAVL